MSDSHTNFSANAFVGGAGCAIMGLLGSAALMTRENMRQVRADAAAAQTVGQWQSVAYSLARTLRSTTAALEGTKATIRTRDAEIARLHQALRDADAHTHSLLSQVLATA